MNKELNSINVIVCFVVMCVVVAVGIAYLVPDQSSSITYTEYDIITIDNKRFTYIESNNKIRSIGWADHSRFVNVYTSDRTYLVIETSANAYCRTYNLYLNVSDLQ